MNERSSLFLRGLRQILEFCKTVFVYFLGTPNPIRIKALYRGGTTHGPLYQGCLDDVGSFEGGGNSCKELNFIVVVCRLVRCSCHIHREEEKKDKKLKKEKEKK